MRICESWLREWADPSMSTAALAKQLTMAGLEVGSIERAAPVFTGVVVGQIRDLAPHPDADNLTLCWVDVGAEAELRLVCGASNIYPGMFAPTALIGARLPGGLKIRKSKLRGVASEGMLCSGKELGLSEDADGIFDLGEADALGIDLQRFLDLGDSVFELELTPNRGDCLSVRGVAHEVAALNSLTLNAPDLVSMEPRIDDIFPVDVYAPDACPTYVGRVVRNIDSTSQTPLWMRERLRRSGIRPIHPVVDITNYVMLELGQPMHAFDLKLLEEKIIVRMAEPDERLTLLDGRLVQLDATTLVIADATGPRALAGIMGGENTGVSAQTADIFFESAFFAPLSIAGKARHYLAHTDASHRFERGVDPEGQTAAIERATQLLLQIAGGDPGPVSIAGDASRLPKPHPITLRRRQIERLLGIVLPDEEVVDILERLDLKVTSNEAGWIATPPALRFDLTIEADLIEELARIHGYDNVPEIPSKVSISIAEATETKIPLARAKAVLVDRGYQEAVTYSFVSSSLQAMFTPNQAAIALENPISEDLAEMRLSLWPGLMGALLQNQSRQQGRIRLFESGLRFIPQDSEIKQKNGIAGIIYGDVEPEQWGDRSISSTFHTIKSDVEAILSLCGRRDFVEFVDAIHPALHPGQSARIEIDHNAVGWLGAVHPKVVRALTLERSVFVFELDAEAVLSARVPSFVPVSKFPVIRRDIAVIVDEKVTAKQLLGCVVGSGGENLRDARIFDVYRGKNIDSGRKSIAFGLILGDFSRTLTDSDADATVQKIVSRLKLDFRAKIRD